MQAAGVLALHFDFIVFVLKWLGVDTGLHVER